MDYAEAADRVRHDLGKYVSFATRFVAADAGVDALREALRDDLLHTRRGPEGSEGAVTMWHRLRAPLLGAPGELGALVARLDERIAVIARDLPVIEQGDERALQTLAAHAAEVTSLCRALAVAARSSAGGR